MKTTAFFQRLNYVLRLDTPGPGFVGLLRERARRSPARGSQRLQPPLGAARKPTTPLGVSHGEARKPTAPPGVFHGEVAKPTAPPDFFTAKRKSRLPCPEFATAKRESRQRRSPLPGRAFSAARPAGTARFLITRGKASFYETATFGRRKVFFCSPFCGLLFCPTRAKLALPAGEKPAAPKPRPPRGGPAQRPRPAPGFCAASANARPGDPAPVRLLEKALWAPPTTEPFRKAPSGKPERERQTKGGRLNATPTPGLARPLRLRMAGRAPSRNAPSVAESPQNQHRRSAS